MGTKDKRIDAYIEKSADFAKPVLKHFRQLVHKACPEAEEKVKWGMPFFDYRGGPMAHMAAFKQHCAIGFWKAALMKDNKMLVDNAMSESAMGHLGKITSLKDLPKDFLLVKFIHEGMKLNEMGVKLSKPKKAVVALDPPDYMVKALAKNKKAKAAFDAFSNSHRKEYIQWITEAKTEATRDKRLATAMEWLAEGKSRHWKYA